VLLYGKQEKFLDHLNDIKILERGSAPWSVFLFSPTERDDPAAGCHNLSATTDQCGKISIINIMIPFFERP
jgi:hypothetical protein